MAGARCVVFDVRGCGEGNDRQLLLFWLRATREAIPYEVERSPLSVVSVHDGFYVSRLPLASHSDKEIVAALDSLEQECLHLPLGLTMGQGGLVSEFAAAAPNGLPRSAKKRTKKGDQSDRLFAIGEDAGLAALRSSLAVLAAAEATSSTANLQFWTTDVERLLPVAADVRRCIPGNVRFEVVVAAGLWDDQQTAKVDLLAQELSSMQQAIDLSIHRLQLAEAAVAAKVRRALRRSLPLRLGLAGGLPVIAWPTVLLPSYWQPQGSSASVEILAEVPLAGIGSELLVGVPLLLEAEDENGARVLQALACSLRQRQSALLASAMLQPLTLSPSKCRHLFALQASGGFPMIRGLASFAFGGA